MVNSGLLSALRIILLSLAIRRLTTLVVEDEITRPVRESVTKRFPPETSKTGYLVTCEKCVSVWAAIVVLILDCNARSELRTRSLAQFLLDTLALSEVIIATSEIARTNSSSMFD